jgi:hypothetical protein
MTEPQNGGALALRLHRKMLGAGVPPARDHDLGHWLGKKGTGSALRRN